MLHERIEDDVTEEMRHDLLKSTRGKRNTSCVFVVSAHLDFLGSVWTIKTFFKMDSNSG